MLRDRDMMRVVAARFISRVGGEAAFFVGVWGKAAYGMQMDAGQIALLMGVLAVGSILGTMVAGVLIDRYDPRRVLAIAELVFVPTALAFLLPVSVWQFTVLAGLLGFFGAPALTASASIAPFLTSPDAGLEKVNAWIEGATSVSFVVGPGIGALLARFVSIDSVFVLDAATSLVAVFLIWGVRLNREPAAAEPDRGSAMDAVAPRPSALAELRDGLRYVYTNRSLRFPVMMGTVMWIGFGSFGALEPLFYRDVLKVGIDALGYVNAIFGLGLAAGAWLAARLPSRLMSARGLALVSGLVGLGGILYVGTRSLVIVAIGAITWGVVAGVTEVVLKVVMQSATPDDYMGRSMSAASMHRQAGELLPLAVSPSLARLFGVQPVLIGGGLLLSVAAIASLPEAAAVDRLPRVRDVSAAGVSPRDPTSPLP
jgi:DHA3 family macrolide efflux protein-like MFS transporter